MIGGLSGVSSTPVPKSPPQPQQQGVQKPLVKTPTPSGKMLDHVGKSKSASQLLSKVTNPSLVSRGSQSILSTPPQDLDSSHESMVETLSKTKLGQTIKSISESTVVNRVVEIGSKVDDLTEVEVDILGEEVSIGGLMESLSGEDWTVEKSVLAEQLGISEDTLGSGVKGLSAFLKTATLVDDFKSWVETDSDDPEINAKRLKLATDVYSTLGGESTLKLGKAVSAYYENPTMDTFKKMLTAAGELQKDDSTVASLEMTALKMGSQLILGSTTTGLLSRVTPGLSYASTAIDTGVAMKSFYDWYTGSGNETGLEVVKKSITALGSGAGITVAPVVGPLTAVALNTTIDVSSYVVSSVSSWWYG